MLSSVIDEHADFDLLAAAASVNVQLEALSSKVLLGFGNAAAQAKPAPRRDDTNMLANIMREREKKYLAKEKYVQLK